MHITKHYLNGFKTQNYDSIFRISSKGWNKTCPFKTNKENPKEKKGKESETIRQLSVADIASIIMTVSYVCYKLRKQISN